jgi:predicted 3-demethylubiquinone-9 3-methyltransferase (glyoxalase superfamily)
MISNPIFPCLWFDNQAKEAADFYCNAFSNSSITSENPMVVIFELEGKKFMGLNGGPIFKINPSISMLVTYSTNAEIETLWKKLSAGGSALMPLDKYAWSELYGWVKDKYGMTWQLMKGDLPAGAPKITPSFLFANEQYGRAEEAIQFYTSIFPHSSIQNLQHYQAGEQQEEGKLMFGQFSLNQNMFSAMDGPGDHQFKFNEALSLVVNCETQDDIDFYWNKLTEGGEESMCGWLKDKFGVSWQIVPVILSKLMSDPEKSPRVIKAFMQMKKFDIEALEKRLK